MSNNERVSLKTFRQMINDASSVFYFETKVQLINNLILNLFSLSDNLSSKFDD